MKDLGVFGNNYNHVEDHAYRYDRNQGLDPHRAREEDKVPEASNSYHAPLPCRTDPFDDVFQRRNRCLGETPEAPNHFSDCRRRTVNDKDTSCSGSVGPCPQHLKEKAHHDANCTSCR